MSEPKDIYLAETSELICNLEMSLLELDKDRGEKKYVEEIFRSMHTIKGNSSMFGYTNIAELIHDLESIFDNIRSLKRNVSDDIINITFATLDHLKIIINDEQLLNKDNSFRHEKLINEIRSLLDDHSILQNSRVETSEEKKIYYIFFKPNKDFLVSGNDPFQILKDLMEMGNTKIIPHFIDSVYLIDFNPLEVYSYWEIFLEACTDIDQIQNCFLLVSDKAEIKIDQIAGAGLLKNSEFIEYINRFIFKDHIAFDENCKRIVENWENPNSSNKDKENKILDVDNSVKKPKEEKQLASIRVASDKLDELMNLVSELVTTQAGLSLYVDNNNVPELESISENVEKISRQLRDITFGMTLVPINNMFGRFQRLVRDLSLQLHKNVEFVTEGGETELDKSMIDVLTDPLLHLLRNSLDHGIESESERLKLGKSKNGKIFLKAYYSGVFVYIQISDDGRGIDTEIIKRKAIQKGIIKGEDLLSEKEIFDLLFYPGFSTAQQITDVSGRGVGMDVVKKNINNLRGEIYINSQINFGTTMTIKLPLTLSIIDGLLVDVDNVKYVIPLSVVIKCYEVNNNEMKDNFNNLLVLDGEQVPFINLRELFNCKFEPDSTSHLIVVSNGEEKVGISVDFIVGEYQAVIKPIGKYYKNQDFVSGATILGDGTIALVIDPYKMVSLYTQIINTI